MAAQRMKGLQHKREAAPLHGQLESIAGESASVVARTALPRKSTTLIYAAEKPCCRHHYGATLETLGGRGKLLQNAVSGSETILVPVSFVRLTGP
jgi:hypothetical protein